MPASPARDSETLGILVKSSRYLYSILVRFVEGKLSLGGGVSIHCLLFPTPSRAGASRVRGTTLTRMRPYWFLLSEYRSDPNSLPLTLPLMG